MTYYNKTLYKVYYYGYLINPQSIFIYKGDIYNINNNIVNDILKSVFTEIEGNINLYITECRKYNYVSFDYLNGNDIIVNNVNLTNDNIAKYLNLKFSKEDLVIIKNSVNLSQIISWE